MKRNGLNSIRLALLLSSIACAQLQSTRQEQLIGTWKLVSWMDVTDKGVSVATHGSSPTGFLTYTANGRMSAVLSHGDRKILSNSTWNVAPTDERAEAFATSMAYAGTFTVKGDKVFHHVEVCTFQNYVNTDLVRIITKFEGNRVTLRTTTSFSGADGVKYAYRELVWDRVK